MIRGFHLSSVYLSEPFCFSNLIVDVLQFYLYFFLASRPSICSSNLLLFVCFFNNQGLLWFLFPHMLLDVVCNLLKLILIYHAGCYTVILRPQENYFKRECLQDKLNLHVLQCQNLNMNLNLDLTIKQKVRTVGLQSTISFKYFIFGVTSVGL